MTFYAYVLETYYKNLSYEGKVYPRCKVNETMYLDVFHPNQGEEYLIVPVTPNRPFLKEILADFHQPQ
jgi:hypothetical protein